MEIWVSWENNSVVNPPIKLLYLLCHKRLTVRVQTEGGMYSTVATKPLEYWLEMFRRHKHDY